MPWTSSNYMSPYASFNLVLINLQKERLGFKFAFEGTKTSPNWSHFFEAVDPAKKVAHIVCIHCKWIGPHPNRSASRSPGRLGRHLSVCHKYQSTLRKSVVAQLVEQNRRPYIETEMNSQKLTEAVLNGAIQSNISFRAATNPVWMSLLKQGFPNLKIPDRRALPRLLEQRAMEARSDLKTRLSLNDSKISLALDGWTSTTNISFQGTCVHSLKLIS